MIPYGASMIANKKNLAHPTHHGSQKWEGAKGLKGVLKAIVHVAGEANLFRKDEDKVNQAAGNIREYYQNSVKMKDKYYKEKQIKNAPNNGSGMGGMEKTKIKIHIKVE
jgi:hypothetical protein